MESNELRIGNLIQINRHGGFEVITVAHVGEGIINYMDENEYSPIPLSVEWLERAGFKFRNELRGEGALMDLESENWKETLTVGMDYAKNGGGWSILCIGRHNVFYVHQLQNLYFVLSGKELDFHPL